MTLTRYSYTIGKKNNNKTSTATCMCLKAIWCNKSVRVISWGLDKFSYFDSTSYSPWTLSDRFIWCFACLWYFERNVSWSKLFTTNGLVLMDWTRNSNFSLICCIIFAVFRVFACYVMTIQGFFFVEHNWHLNIQHKQKLSSCRDGRAVLRMTLHISKQY